MITKSFTMTRREVDELMYYESWADEMDEEEDVRGAILDLASWIEAHLDDLSDAWWEIRDYREQTGNMLFDAADFNDFCEAMYKTSTKTA